MTAVPIPIVHGFVKNSIAFLPDKLEPASFKKSEQFAELHIINYNMVSGRQLAMDARMAQGMEKNGDSREALKSVKNVGDNISWFRDTPHYWASASLPLAYALACVEVVSKSSEKPANHLVDSAIRMGAETVPVGVGKTLVFRKKGIDKEQK